MDNQKEQTIYSNEIDLNSLRPYILSIDNIFVDVAVEYINNSLLVWDGIKPGS
jgi:hypothetical protein